MRLAQSSLQIATTFMLFAAIVRRGSAFVSKVSGPLSSLAYTSLSMSSVVTTTQVPSWTELQSKSKETAVGKALEAESALRQEGKGSAFVQNKLRKFQSEDNPQITIFRDHAGWCPYCQKLMLLIEEKETPVKIELVPMRSYGDKPQEFLQKVPNGLLPALEVKGQIITESQVIMELLDQWHTPEMGFKAMMPAEDDRAGRTRYEKLARLTRPSESS